MNLFERLARLFGFGKPPEPQVLAAPAQVLAAPTHPSVAVAHTLDPSDDCLDLIKHFESLELKAYPDPGSLLGHACSSRGLPMREYRLISGWQNMDGAPWTIGYGETGPLVVEGVETTQLEALRQLQHHVDYFAAMVRGALKGVHVTQGQFDALTSFAYNVGHGAAGVKDGLIELRSGGPSTLLRLTINGATTVAADEFLKWTKARGVELPGLVRRRRTEREMYLSRDWRQFLS